MSVPNYVLKAEVLKTPLCKEINRIDKARYLYECDGVIAPFDYDLEEWSLYAEKGYSKEQIKEARRINNASYKRVNRLEDRIMSYLQKGHCIWLTLTFDEDTLNNTTPETRRKYVRRFLKTQSNYYVANIDYGKTTQREHYHAVVVCDYVDMSAWSYGFSYTERIKNHCKTPLKLSKYVSKLTNHAIKETTHRQVYIYSREIAK